MVNIFEIEQARDRLKGVTHHTPLFASATLAEITGAQQVSLKLENFQSTGSFKIRGAYNRIAQLTLEERRRGVIAASAGNHAQGVAKGARFAGIKATIVVPENAATAKIDAIRNYGVEPICFGQDYYEAEAEAHRIQEERGLVFIHAFDDPAVIAGQGTIGLEIFDDLPDVDIVIAGIGGGGLVSGVATAIKSRKPNTRVIGVEPVGSAKVSQSMAAGRTVVLESVSTIADGLATRQLGELPFCIIQQIVDDVVTVTDDELSESILFLNQRSKMVVEGAGAAPLASLLSRKVDVRGQNVALILSGGNIDLKVQHRILGA